MIWYCPGAHTDDDGEPTGTGHVGIIARDLECNQAGLTLGEILEAVLSHDREQHS